jgi:hypothetical protein
MKVIIEQELGDDWASSEEFAEMTDTQVVELCWEDIGKLLEGATWTVIRP